MYIILSQKIDTASEYADKLFETYHFPSRYKNQIHEGDTFVYYQGNRYIKAQRYYFGFGTIGKITTTDRENYYASIINGQSFCNKVPIYLPDGKYVEQLGFETVRKSPNPPWQSSIRPLSQQAFDYIIESAKVQKQESNVSIDELKNRLKTYIKAFYLENDANAIFEIENIASSIISSLNIVKTSSDNKASEKTIKAPDNKVQSFLYYCETTHISYSYKPVLILAFFKCTDRQGSMKLADGIQWIKKYYKDRRAQGKKAEKNKSIYIKDDVTDDKIRCNLILNPIKALTGSGFFSFNHETQELHILPEVWFNLQCSEINHILEICNKRLEKYFND